MSPAALLRAVGRLEARLETETKGENGAGGGVAPKGTLAALGGEGQGAAQATTTPVKPKSKPITPVSGGRGAAAPKTIFDAMDYPEWKKLREADIARRRSGATR